MVGSVYIPDMLKLIHYDAKSSKTEGVCTDCGWSWFSYDVEEINRRFETHHEDMHTPQPHPAEYFTLGTFRTS